MSYRQPCIPVTLRPVLLLWHQGLDLVVFGGGCGATTLWVTGEISWGASSFVGLPLISVIVSSVGTGSLFFGNAIAFGAVALGFYWLLYRHGPK